jgi:hypothetical protein
MKLVLEVTDLQGAKREVTAGFSDQVRYEEITGRTVTTWGSSPPGVRDWALLAWLAETREAKPFRAWTDVAEMVTLVRTVDADPTQPGAAPGTP